MLSVNGQKGISAIKVLIIDYDYDYYYYKKMVNFVLRWLPTGSLKSGKMQIPTSKSVHGYFVKV